MRFLTLPILALAFSGCGDKLEGSAQRGAAQGGNNNMIGKVDTDVQPRSSSRSASASGDEAPSLRSKNRSLASLRPGSGADDTRATLIQEKLCAAEQEECSLRLPEGVAALTAEDQVGITDTYLGECDLIYKNSQAPSPHKQILMRLGAELLSIIHTHEISAEHRASLVKQLGHVTGLLKRTPANGLADKLVTQPALRTLVMLLDMDLRDETKQAVEAAAAAVLSSNKSQEQLMTALTEAVQNTYQEVTLGIKNLDAATRKRFAAPALVDALRKIADRLSGEDSLAGARSSTDEDEEGGEEEGGEEEGGEEDDSDQ